jgi:hypothetical protein
MQLRAKVIAFKYTNTAVQARIDVKRGFTKINNQANRRTIIGYSYPAKRDPGTATNLFIRQNGSSS